MSWRVIIRLYLKLATTFLGECFAAEVVVARKGSPIPLYAVACVRVGSFAPWTSKSVGTSRFRGSGHHLFAPCFASASLPSLPGFPSCPFTHCMVVVADLQSLKKLSQCFAVLGRLTWHKSNKLPNNLKIIYIIV